MKNLKFLSLAFVLFFALQSNAQVSINLNIGSRPDWCGNYYDDRVQYVYLPELECYYDNYTEVYVYYGPNGWCRSRYLPDYCHGYNINRAHRVVIDYRGNSPWVNFDYHRNYYWRDNYRNYRQEYYGNNYYRRGNHVVVYNNKNYRNHGHDHNRYERRGNGNAYGHYKKDRDHDDDDDDRRRNQNPGQGRGQGRR
jgi:hypothetical protein